MKLLTYEELQKSIEEIIITDDYSHGVQMRTINKMEKLIATQKKLYADSVIGEDDVLTYPTYPVRLKERNELRAEQRARIE